MFFVFGYDHLHLMPSVKTWFSTFLIWNAVLLCPNLAWTMCYMESKINQVLVCSILKIHFMLFKFLVKFYCIDEHKHTRTSLSKVWQVNKLKKMFFYFFLNERKIPQRKTVSIVFFIKLQRFNNFIDLWLTKTVFFCFADRLLSY